VVGARKHDDDGEDEDAANTATRWATAAAPLPRQKAKDIQVVQQDKKRRARTGQGYMRRLGSGWAGAVVRSWATRRITGLGTFA
jgi:hypothetical protein